MSQRSWTVAGAIALAALIGGTAVGQSAAPRMSLHDVLALAAAQSPTLAQAGIEIEVSEARVQAAQGIDDWVITADASWRSSRSKPVEGEPYQQTENDRISLSGGVTRNLPTGGRVGVNLEGAWNRAVTRMDLGEQLLTADVDVWAPALSLTFYQPILQGGGDVSRAERRRAEASRDVATLQRLSTAAAVVRDIVTAYWELSYAVEVLEIRRASLALAQEQLRIVQAGIDVGRLPRTATAEVEATIALREEEVLLAEQALAERALEVRRLAGLEIGPNALDLIATDRPVVEATVPDVHGAVEDAMSQNPELAALRAQGRSASIEVEVAEDGLLPSLNFTAAAGPTGNDSRLGAALGQLATFDAYSVQAGLSFSSPLRNRAAKGNVAVARGQLSKVRMNEADVRAQIAVSVVRAVNALRSAKKRMDVLVKSTDAAQVNLETEQARFDVGRATSFDVLKRQDELSQARLRQARARIDYLQAQANLEALTGQILPRHGIQVADR